MQAVIAGRSIGWKDAMQAYFGLALTDEQVALWEQEIQASVKDLMPGELAAAIRAASFQDRSGYSGKPTLKELRIWVYQKRKADRGEVQTSKASKGCGNCLDGWFDYIRRSGQYKGAGIGIPCTCHCGQDVGKDFDAQAMAHFRVLVESEIAARMKRDAEAAKLSGARGWSPSHTSIQPVRDVAAAMRDRARELELDDDAMME